MVKREELEAKIKEKVLLIGDSGTGKTYTSVKIAEHVAKAGKKVILVDPEYGAERELELLGDDVLANIELKIVPEWKKYVEAVEKNDACFLKIVDGLNDAFEMSKAYLEERFVKRGEYITRDEHVQKIEDKELFVLPFTTYSKVYDEVRRLCRSLVEQAPHIIVTMYGLGEKDAKKRLSEDIYRKFDTVIELRLTSTEKGEMKYDAVLKKHRGRPMAVFYILNDHITQLKNLFDKRLGGVVK